MAIILSISSGAIFGHAATLEAGAGGLSDEIAKNGTAEVFADGFESGTTAAWSDTVPPSSPDQIANLWGWWDAAVGVTVTDGLVSSWADQSANNRHWTQTSAPNRPRYIPVAQGDRPALEWDRNNDAWLDLSDYINPDGNDIEVFVVGRPTPTQKWSGVIQQRDNLGTGRAWLYFLGADLQTYIGGAPITGVGEVDIFDVNVYHTSYDDSDGRLVLYNNGTPVADATGVNGEPCQGNLYLGRHKDTGRIEGYIYEVIIYDRALTSVERNFVVEYLRSKWKIAWSEVAASPATINNLWGWWTADAGVTLTQDGVSFWADQSGSGPLLAQSITYRRPQLTPDAQNGLPGITFDDENDHLESFSDTLDFATEDATIFVVMNTSDSTAAAPIGSLDGPTGTGRAWFENEYGYGQVYIGGFPAPLSLEFGTVTGPAILTVYYSGSHGVTQYAVNEWIWGMARDVVGEPNPDGGIRVGDTKSDFNDLNGQIYEIAVFNRALTWSERQRLINYLNAKWAIY